MEQSILSRKVKMNVTTITNALVNEGHVKKTLLLLTNVKSAHGIIFLSRLVRTSGFYDNHFL